MPDSKTHSGRHLPGRHRVVCTSRIEDCGAKALEGCGYTWVFAPRKKASELKHSRDVKCPRCGRKLFRRGPS